MTGLENGGHAIVGLFHVELLHKGTGLEFRNSLVSRKFIPAVSSWMPLILKFLMQLQFQDNKLKLGGRLV